MLEEVERRRRVLVEPRLVSPERRQHLHRGVYGVETEMAGARRVRRDAGELHVEPQHADLGDGDVVRMRLGNDASVGPHPIQQTLQRTVPRALLLDDGLQLYVRRRSISGALQRPHRAGHGGEAGLHVPRAAAVEPIPHANRLERRVGPQRLRGRRHDVHVAVQDERTSPATSRLPARDDVALAPHIPRKR